MAFDIGVGQIMGAALGAWQADANDDRQIRQNEKLFDQQNRWDEARMQKAYDMSLDYWNATNYSSQIDKMKEAGLNPALIYKSNSPGGATINTGQSVQKQDAPKGGHEVMDMAAMGMNTALQQAQIKVMESQANLNNTEAEKKGGIDTKVGEATLQSIAAEITETKAKTAVLNMDTKLKEIEANIQGSTQEEQISKIGLGMQQAHEEWEKLVRENSIGNATRDTVIKQVQANLTLTGVTTALQKSGIDVNSQHIKESIAKIVNMAAEIRIKESQLGINEKDAETNRMNWETKQQEAGIHQQHQTLQQYVNDISNGNKEVMNMVTKILQAVTLKGALQSGPTRSPIGFKP